MKVGFVNIFGKPNAGKSTLLNALMGEKLAIVSPKVQTTRHRIKGILNDKQYQIILSDTPGIIEPQYKLHDKMMKAVKGSLEDADLALLLVDLEEDWEDCDRVFSALRLNVPAIVLLNKLDRVTPEKIQEGLKFFEGKPYCKKAIAISALSGLKKKKFISEILNFLPEGEPYYNTDDISDLPSKFFVGELVREKIYTLYAQEIPYHTTVLVQEFREQPQLTRIRAEIVVQRESQKGIILGEGGKMIKKLGIQARKDIEDFLQQKVHLELFVKVRGKWRDDELYLKEYGYS